MIKASAKVMEVIRGTDSTVERKTTSILSKVRMTSKDFRSFAFSMQSLPF